jgi:RHS repeat-associated protein
MARLPSIAVLQWNALDQLASVDLGGGGTAHYVYGIGGQRVRRVVDRPGGLRIEQICLGPYQVRRERMDNGPVRLEHELIHIHDDGGPIAQLETKTVDTQNAEPANQVGVALVVYRYTNATGSATLLTDNNGTPVVYEEYHPFGTSAYRLAKPGVNHSLKQYRFAGKHRDEETGLYCFGARYYAPWLGRWTSSDPAGLAGGGNLYRYCMNNPIGRSDPGGTQDRPLNPAGEVSWVVPSRVFIENGQRVSDAVAKQNFATWIAQEHPDRPFTPGTVTVDWGSFRAPSTGANGQVVPGRGPTFNAEWINPATGRPLLPRPGEFGYVAPQNQQERARYADPVARTGRLTENEHTTPTAQERAIDPTHDATVTRTVPTVRNTRNVALDKTRGDNARSAAIKQQVQNGQPANATEMDMASRDGFQAANERARAAGQPHIDDPGSIDRGTLEQVGSRFERGKSQTVPAGAAIEEPHIAPDNATQNPPANPPAPAPAAPSSGGGGFAPAAVNFGGNFALNATRTFVPGVAEAEVAFATGSMYAYASGYAGAGLALETAAAYTPIVGGSFVAGAMGGNLAEAGMAQLTSNRDAQLAAGVVGAAATGAAVGALIGSVVPIAGTVIGAGTGAIVGAVCGLAGYLIAKFW